MEISALKKYILNEDKIPVLLEAIGCHDIKFHPSKEFYSCANPDGDNKGAINVKANEYLNVVNWTRQKYFNEKSDLVSLVQFAKKLEFMDAVKFIHKILGLEFTYHYKEKKKTNPKDPLEVFKKHRYGKVDANDIHVISENLLDDYFPLLHIDWFREGIMPWTREKFNIAYSYRRKRIIIPMRYWATGELLGVNSRTTIENYEELNIKKFFITPTYQKGLNLYGLYENYESIKKAGYVVVYESEKSVLKRHSLGDGTGVALSGHTMSDEQARILVGLNVDIIISMDNDIDIEEVRFMCEKFYQIRRVYYTKDKWHLLGEKDSVADRENKIFNFFMKYKIAYDGQEHRLYEKFCKTRKDKI